MTNCAGCIHHEIERDTGFDYCTHPDFEETWLDECEHNVTDQDIEDEKADRKYQEMKDNGG